MVTQFDDFKVWEFSTLSSSSLGPKILFDESHGGLSIDAIRAINIEPSHPDYHDARILAQEVGKTYTIDPLINGPITTDVLNNYQILILTAPDGWIPRKRLMQY